VKHGIQAADFLWQRAEYDRTGEDIRGGDRNPRREALARAGDLDAADVAVTSVGSTIVLSGTVAFPEEVAIAEDIASRIPGVDAVDNQISVVSSGDVTPRTL